MKRLLCWLYMGHFVRRTPYIHLGQMRYWTHAICWCGLLDVRVPGTPTREEITAYAKKMISLAGFGV